jgi:hypothetical protein
VWENEYVALPFASAVIVAFADPSPKFRVYVVEAAPPVNVPLAVVANPAYCATGEKLSEAVPLKVVGPCAFGRLGVVPAGAAVAVDPPRKTGLPVTGLPERGAPTPERGAPAFERGETTIS